MAALDLASVGITKEALLGGGMVFIFVIIFGLIAVAIIWAMIYLSRFNVIVTAEERRGNSVVEYTTRGGILINPKTGVKEFVIWRRKWAWASPIRGAVPNHEHFRMTSTGKRILRIFKDDIDTYKVLPPQSKKFYDKWFKRKTKEQLATEKLQGIVNAEAQGNIPEYLTVPNVKFDELEPPVDLDWMNWSTQTVKGYAERFRNNMGFLQQNAGLVGLMGVIFLMTVFVIVGFQKWEDGSANLASAAQSNAQATQRIVEANLQMVGITTIQPQSNPGQTPTQQQVINSLGSGVTG